MRITQKKSGRPINKKMTDRLCGRLVHWDARTPQEESVIPIVDYCFMRSDFSTQNERKPDLPPNDIPKTTLNSVSAIQKVLERFKLTRAHRNNHHCGRLIVWDVGTSGERFVKLEENYQHLQYDLSSNIELKPYVHSPRGVCKSSSSLKPLAERFYSRHGYSHKDLYKKKHSSED